MRSLWAGLFLLAIASSAAFAQVRGEVESVGFGGPGWYRPECWTPMVVRLQSEVSDPAEYRIEVHQRDLDFDHVIYVKDGITLNGHATQRWEVCFLPKPTNGGLPDGNLADLQDKLRVYVTNKDGSRQLLQLPITSTVQTLESAAGGFNQQKGNRLVLYVAEGSSKPAWSEYDQAKGLVEQTIPVRVPARDLPQSVLAYQAVDALVWVSGDARVLNEEGSKQLAALQQWVHQGGLLIVCQPGSDGERQNIAPFAEMLPILWQENGQWQVSVKTKDNLEPLPTLARWRDSALERPKAWDLKGPFAFARATAKPNAVVNEWVPWDDKGKDMTPYIARVPYGLGSVTWVAQDVGNPSITGPKTAAWPYIWDRIFGWRNDTRVAGDIQRDSKAFDISFTDSPLDLGYAQLRGVEFPSKGAGLISLAVFFFIAYWIIAGPGMYLFLAGRKRKELSWTAFGVTALTATLITVLLVRLVLRGSPEIHHSTDVRIASGGPDAQPAIVYSRIGLYIPRDGEQHVALADASPDLVSYVAPMSISPMYVPDNEFPANLDYRVPVPGEGASALAVEVPFRSTLKKLQAKWSGNLGGGSIRANDVKLNLTGGFRDPIHGSLDNLSGIDFRNVYIAFNYNNEDHVLYMPSWPAAAGRNRIDLTAEYPRANQLPLGGIVTPGREARPEDQKPCAGQISKQWSYYWDHRLQGASERLDDLNNEVPVSLPMLSFFDRVPPARNEEGTNKAMTILRRGARNLNMSAALAAGDLIVLAQADRRPLPFPLQVNGDKIGGEGTVFYQFALPLDRAGIDAPAPPAAAEQ